ncbi:EAL domain-containing protein [Deinococcus depolymerans]|uniref:EAL domain-containing protein n=1 Tax=Deinococcus depolymerans TaxID=392408 RepID=A0ABN1BMR8_9DEIO
MSQAGSAEQPADGAAADEVLRVLSASAAALLTADACGHLLSVTPALLQWLGHTEDTLSGQPLADLVAPAHHGRLDALLAGTSRRPDDPVSTDLDLRRADGRWAAAQVRALPLPHPPRATLLVVLSAPGLTPPGIPDSVDLYRELVDHLPIDVVLFDPQGRYLYCNPAAIRDPAIRAAVVGLTNPEYAVWRGHPAGLAHERVGRFREAATQRRAVQWEEVLRVGTEDRVFRRAYWPVFNPDGTLRLMIGHGTDVTRSVEQGQRMTLLETMVATSVDPLLLLDARPGPAYLTVTYGNPALYALLRQQGLQELPTMPLPDWPLGDGNRVTIRAMLAHLHPREPHREVLYLPDAHQWLEVNASPILAADGQCSHWAINLRDVSDSERATQVQTHVASANRLALGGHPLEESAEALLGGIEPLNPGWKVALVVAHPDSGLQVVGEVNPTFRQTVTGVPSMHLQEVWGHADPDRAGLSMNIPDLLAFDSPFPVARAIAPLLGVRTLAQLPLYGRDGQLLGVLLAAHADPRQWMEPLTDALRLRVPAASMLVERHLQQQRLSKLAFTDALTGLMNRVTLGEQLDRLLRAAERDGNRLAFGLMDLDRFKFLNDGYGHLVGDRLLQQLARRLERVCGAYGVPALARMGGDEFAVVVPADRQPDLTGALNTVFDQPFDTGSGAVLMQASLGWSVYPDTAHNASELHQQADAAMYTAKRRQLFAQVFEAGARTGRQTLTLETALRESLRDGDFHLVFQPQVSVRSGALVGAEALLRWTHPVLGAVPPDQFIPVAEMSGLMGSLGVWVLRGACEEAARWTGVCVSVNVSSVQLSTPDFAAQVRAALSHSGLDPHRLVLEVTETGLIDNPARTRETLQTLRDDGVRISIDDFGTGYSSLVSVRTLPVDELKIDRSFIRDLGQDTQAGRESRAIVSASVLMAHAMGIAVVAEGVETPGQAAQLAELGCDLMQGWLYAPGLSAEQFSAWQAQWSGTPSTT